MGLPSAEARRMSPLPLIGRRVGILLEVLADLTGPLGDRVNAYFLVKLGEFPRSQRTSSTAAVLGLRSCCHHWYAKNDVA